MPSEDQATPPPPTPPVENPTGTVVHDWIARRVAADEQMRRAGRERRG